MSGIIEIAATILGVLELGAKIKEVAEKIIPSPVKELTEKYSWLQCTIKNETQFKIIYRDTYFDSGRYWDGPENVQPFDQLVFACCNRDGEPTGVTGGTSFRLSLDDKHYSDFALGWTNPLLGSYKAGAIESGNPKDGYDVADDDGETIEIKNIFEGKDKDGKPSKFKIQISSIPSQRPKFIVTQILVT